MINQDNKIQSSNTENKKISTVDHNNYNNKQLVHQIQKYQPSWITKMLLSKIKQCEDSPWKLLNNVSQLIKVLIKDSPENYYKPNQVYNGKFQCQGAVHFINPQQIYIGSETTIEHGALIAGPCLIGPNCEIRKGAYIRGFAILGNGCLIGNSCQVKNSILMDRCQIAHFNYIGDSILGIHSHFAAGAIISNYKLDGMLIKVNKCVGQKITVQQGNGKKQKQIQVEIITTERTKLGAIIGHNTEIGCNAVLNPGAVIGRNSVIYPLTNWKGYLGANKICKLKQQHVVVQKR